MDPVPDKGNLSLFTRLLWWSATWGMYTNLHIGYRFQRKRKNEVLKRNPIPCLNMGRHEKPVSWRAGLGALPVAASFEWFGLNCGVIHYDLPTEQDWQGQRAEGIPPCVTDHLEIQCIKAYRDFLQKLHFKSSFLLIKMQALLYTTVFIIVSCFVLPSLQGNAHRHHRRTQSVSLLNEVERTGSTGNSVCPYTVHVTDKELTIGQQRVTINFVELVCSGTCHECTNTGRSCQQIKTQIKVKATLPDSVQEELVVGDVRSGCVCALPEIGRSAAIVEA